MPRSRASDLHGFLAVDKSPGWTSHDIVARIRGLTGVRRVGHAGTLDPFATGVLVVGVGKATRLISYAQHSPKRYRAKIRLGIETDTLDPEGKVIHEQRVDCWPSLVAVLDVVESFVGEIEQTPPAYSAVRIDGRRAYDRARAGEKVDVPSRLVTIHSIVVRSYSPPVLEIDVMCGTGTYIRSLARDIGAELGTGGYCLELRRVAVGDFVVEGCWKIEALAEANLRENWSRIAIPPDRVVQSLPKIVLSREQTRAWYHGQSIPGLQAADEESTTLRAYSDSGTFAGIGKLDPVGSLRPVLVFAID